MNRVVVVGTSAAGIAAARELRAEGFTGDLTLIGAEPHVPYDRTALSKDLLLGRVAVDDIALAPPDELDALAATWHLGRRATALRPGERAVLLDDGTRLDYDGLVLATGSIPRRLGFTEPAGVHHLRSLDDARALDETLRERPHVVLVGGGFIGLELAAVARQRGCEVTVLELGPAPLAGILGTAVGQALTNRHRAQGVTVRTGIAVRAFASAPASAPRLTGVVLGDGEIVPADIALVGVGAVPATDWLAGSGLGGPLGVDADRQLATAAPDVVVAGDLARFPHPAAPGGRPVRIEHFEHAQASGAAAARRLLSRDGLESYAPIPHVWSHQFGHALHVAGFPTADAQLSVLEGELADGPFVVAYSRDGRRTAVAALDAPRSFRQHRRSLQLEGVPA